MRCESPSEAGCVPANASFRRTMQNTGIAPSYSPILPMILFTKFRTETSVTPNNSASSFWVPQNLLCSGFLRNM